MSSVIRDSLGFPLLRYVIGLQNLRHPVNQSGAKGKQIVDSVARVFPGLT